MAAAEELPPATTSDGRPADTADLGKGSIALMLGLTLVVGLGLFFFLPLLVARFVAGGQPGIVERVVEGVVQVAIFLGYLILIGRTSDVRRTFQYHGAEHMTIHALEAGDPLTVEAVRKYPTAHPRCGTEFLVVVILVSIVTFSIVGRQEHPADDPQPAHPHPGDRGGQLRAPPLRRPPPRQPARARPLRARASGSRRSRRSSRPTT